MKGKKQLRVQDRNGAQIGDTYYNKANPKDHSFCKKCHAIYHNKRWHFDDDEFKKILKISVKSDVVCPACQKIADGFASGTVILRGQFLKDHEEEILNLVRNEETRAKGLNPLERIIEISPTPEGFEVTTTHEKLAQRIGRRLHRSFSGEVAYRWTPEDKMARVSWIRN